MMTPSLTSMSLRSRSFDAFAARPKPLAAQLLRPGVSHDGDRLDELLADRDRSTLSVHELRTEVEGNLWMLSPEAFLHFLPAFLSASLESYASISVFVSELVGTLTEPSRADVLGGIERARQGSEDLRLADDTFDLLRKQQLEWFDSGTPEAIFHQRFDNLTATEGAAVLAFLDTLNEAHGEDFPFDELRIAIERHWRRYRL